MICKRAKSQHRCQCSKVSLGSCGTASGCRGRRKVGRVRKGRTHKRICERADTTSSQEHFRLDTR